MSLTVLIYHPIRTQEYTDLLRPLLPDVKLLPCHTPAEAAAAVAEADVLFSWKFPAELYAQAKKLRWIQSMGAGVEDLVAAPLPAGVTVTRVEGLFGGFMSEYAFAHMLAHAQQLRRIYANQAAHKWEPFFIGKLAGKRLGVAGSGSIGMEVIKKGKAFGMEVWSLVRSDRPVESADRVFTATASEVQEFTAGVDYLVTVLPLTPETTNLIDPLAMKEGALLINIGRGATIDQQRLHEAVSTHRVHAVLDVFPAEPLAPEDEYWDLPGMTVTPHLSGPSIPSEVAAYFADNYRRFLTGQPLVGLVDRQRGY